MGNQKMMSGADVQLDRISKLGDPLERINTATDREMPIRKRTRKGDCTKGGRPPMDEIMMFKITLLQDWNNISDDNAEYLINGRLSFQRFLGIKVGEKSPDAKMIWLFKERLGKDGMRGLFDSFNEKLQGLGVVEREGSLIDATFEEVTRQRNSREENETVKKGEVPEEWKNPENANRLEQKDTDAR